MKAFLLVLAAAMLTACAAPIDLRGTETTCLVHQVALKNDTVRISYGLHRYPEGYFDAERSMFPNAKPWIGGPCMGGEPDSARVLFCPACRNARDQWMQAHRGQ